MVSEQTQNVARKIEGPLREQILFSVCTLVNDTEQYNQMVASFRCGGFNDDSSEFLYIDNSKGNVFDAYEGLNCLISNARGKYLILCHQDVALLEDNRGTLEQRLCELDRLDPSWSLAGNAGVDEHGKSGDRYTDGRGVEYVTDNLPHKVSSLDENFLVLKSSSRLGFSRDLAGFHFYGADICLQAEFRGWSAYVIDFHLRHDGFGTIDEKFFACRTNLEQKCGRFMRPRNLKTTCSTAYLMPIDWRRKLCRRLFKLRWYRRAVWKWMRGKPIPVKN